MAEISQTDILLQIAQTLATVQGQAQGGMDVASALDKMTQTLAELANRTRPENPEHNGISAFSHPEGDFKHPKDPFKCEMFWCGYPLTLETHTPAEIAALNTLEPGDYFVTKGNGNRVPFTVTGRKRQNGTLESLWIAFPCKGDQSTDHRSLIDYCREAMGEKVRSISDMQSEIAALREQLAEQAVA
jgi:hypothetical protein